MDFCRTNNNCTISKWKPYWWQYDGLTTWVHRQTSICRICSQAKPRSTGFRSITFISINQSINQSTRQSGVCNRAKKPGYTYVFQISCTRANHFEEIRLQIKQSHCSNARAFDAVEHVLTRTARRPIYVCWDRILLVGSITLLNTSISRFAVNRSTNMHVTSVFANRSMPSSSWNGGTRGYISIVDWSADYTSRTRVIY